ncbi:hypothetical protein Dda_0856 [Drechslerella dactyloides]|uniref:Multiple myeloma tumor-associated protein 2-like N-terminal domain-containing protein n=1 Tax=Drechslerella dactyloides TaxID=74499 RepID=A0AAD6J8A4_DREDA|nr:hypothetical protein Dda_0856 [Drechslerella dactyloides]
MTSGKVLCLEASKDISSSHEGAAPKAGEIYTRRKQKHPLVLEGCRPEYSAQQDLAEPAKGTADAARQLDVLLHDGHPLGVYRAQVRVLKQVDEEGFGGLLQGLQGLALPAHRVGGAVEVRVDNVDLLGADFADEAAEGELAQQEWMVDVRWTPDERRFPPVLVPGTVLPLPPRDERLDSGLDGFERRERVAELLEILSAGGDAMGGGMEMRDGWADDDAGASSVKGRAGSRDRQQRTATTIATVRDVYSGERRQALLKEKRRKEGRRRKKKMNYSSGFRKVGNLSLSLRGGLLSRAQLNEWLGDAPPFFALRGASSNSRSDRVKLSAIAIVTSPLQASPPTTTIAANGPAQGPHPRGQPWSDVKDSKDREYYLGVSVKAPTGRWQQNRDIQWYSRAAGSPAAEEAARARAEEVRKIKEAENDALSAALGFKVAARRTDPGLSQGEVDRAIKEAAGGADERDEGGNEKGVGFGRMGMQLYAGGSGNQETMAGNANEEPVRWRPAANADRGDGDRRRRDDRDRRVDEDVIITAPGREIERKRETGTATEIGNAPGGTAHTRETEPESTKATGGDGTGQDRRAEVRDGTTSGGTTTGGTAIATATETIAGGDTIDDSLQHPPSFRLLRRYQNEHLQATHARRSAFISFISKQMYKSDKMLFYALPKSTAMLSYNSSCFLPPGTGAISTVSGIDMMFTTSDVHPRKCCTPFALPVSCSYCSHAKPVTTHCLKTFSTMFFRSWLYSRAAVFWCGPSTDPISCKTQTPQPKRTPQLLLVADNLQYRAQLVRIVRHEAQQERKDAHVPDVADMRALLKRIHGCVAIALLLVAPVQVVDVVQDRLLVPPVLPGVVLLAERQRDVDVQLARVRRLRARVVVDAASEAVSRGAAAPAVGFLCREGLAVVGADFAGLGVAEPEVLSAEQRVDAAQIGFRGGQDGVVDAVAAELVHLGEQLGEVAGEAWVCVAGVVGPFLDEFGEDEDEGWRVGVVRVLGLEFAGHLAASFVAEDLLAGDPAVVVHQVVPAADNLHAANECAINVPFDDGQQVESLVPEEPAWEERPAGDGCEQRGGALHLAEVPLAVGLGGLPEVLVVLRVLGAVDERGAVEEADAAEQVGEELAGEGFVLDGVEGRLALEDRIEPGAKAGLVLLDLFRHHVG